jgi:hypothetical protein
MAHNGFTLPYEGRGNDYGYFSLGIFVFDLGFKAVEAMEATMRA